MITTTTPNDRMSANTSDPTIAPNAVIVGDGGLPVCIQSPSPMCLTWDILDKVMAYSQRADASRLSRTCRTLLDLAPRYLLREVRLSSPDEFLLFYAFLFSGRHDGFRFLKVLQVDTGTDDEWDQRIPDLNDRLTTLFARASGLRALSIHDTYYFDRDERVSAALSSMTNLRTLEIQRVTRHTASLLQSMQAPLTCLDFPLRDLGSDNARPTLATLLAPFRNSLRVLEVRSAHFDNNTMQFPCLTSLRGSVLGSLVDLRNIVQSFPNLRDLDISTDERGEEGQIESCRRHNQQVQAQYHWPSLRYLSGPLQTLYMLGVDCRVQEVDLKWGDLKDGTDGEQLSAVLAGTQPIILKLRIRLPGINTSLLGGYLSSAKGALRELSISFSYCPQSVGVNLAQSVIEAFESLSNFSFQTLKICIDPLYRLDAILLGIEEPLIQSVNHAVVAQHAARCIPAVHWITVDKELYREVYEVHDEVDVTSVLVRQETTTMTAEDLAFEPNSSDFPTWQDWYDGCPAFWRL